MHTYQIKFGIFRLFLTIKNRKQSFKKTTVPCRDVRVGPKVGQIGPKWIEFGTFPDQISVHFGSRGYGNFAGSFAQDIYGNFIASVQ